MTWNDIFLLCFAIGALWTFATLVLGASRIGHAGHAGHHGGHLHGAGKGVKVGHAGGHLASMINPSGIAVFLAWFGGVGYILSRHSGLALWIDVSIAGVLGLAGAWVLGSFLRFLQSRESPLDPLDYEMVGVLGRASCPIRPQGTGEVIYVRAGVRRPVPARSEDGSEIGQGQEVIVTRYEQGIAYVRTWDAMTR